LEVLLEATAKSTALSPSVITTEVSEVEQAVSEARDALVGEQRVLAVVVWMALPGSVQEVLGNRKTTAEQVKGVALPVQQEAVLALEADLVLLESHPRQSLRIEPRNPIESSC
jgi:hypothetical protein